MGIVVLTSAAMSQGFSPGLSGPSGVVPALGPGSQQPVLMDPKKIQMHQSVSFSAASGGGSSFSQSLYQNTLDWKLSDPLTLHLDLGILTPLSSSGPAAQGFQRGAYLIPTIGLEYQPSETVKMYFQYSSLPSAPVGSKGGLPWQ